MALVDEERGPARFHPPALEGLVDRFVSLAASSGFSLDELAESLTERAEKADRAEKSERAEKIERPDRDRR